MLGKVRLCVLFIICVESFKIRNLVIFRVIDRYRVRLSLGKVKIRDELTVGGALRLGLML